MKACIISSVKAIGGHSIEVVWKGGTASEVRLAEIIREDKALSPLADKALFSQVKPGLWGHSVVWGDKIDIGADTLWTMAHEQAGLAMPTGAFNLWMERNNLSLSAAAEVLGISRRMVIYYRMGHRPIPKMVGLACKGHEAILKEQKRKKAA